MFTFQSNASDDENKLKFFVDLLEKLISISYCQVKNARASRLFCKGKLDKKKLTGPMKCLNIESHPVVIAFGVRETYILNLQYLFTSNEITIK